MNVFNMGDFDPVTGATKPKKNVDKCCVERDICKQTCGMTSQACHDLFQKCSQKVCKEDQNCKLQAMMADMMSPDPDEEPGSTTKYDPKESECKSYNKGQAEACTCVQEDEFRSATEDKLKSFYKKYNPEKLDKSDNIKDSEELWKKWEKKEPDLIMALTNKYKAKAVKRKAKPKRPEWKPPPKEEDDAEPPPPPKPVKPVLDADDEAFETKLKGLMEKKKKAAADEEYDLADEAKDHIAEAKSLEAKRLKAVKAKAIDEEDYPEAKRVKQRIARLEEL